MFLSCAIGGCRLSDSRIIVPLLLLGSLLPGTLRAETEFPSSETAPLDYSIVVTGNELLSGVYADGHTLFLTRTLRPLGLRCVESMSVNDQAGDIKQALGFLQGRSKLVIVTGGLGPTDNDITREVLSEFTRVPLHEHPAVLERMERRTRTPRDQLRANLRRQTRVPTRGTFLENETGSAVGLVFETDDQVIVALPGPPRELQPMVQSELIPYLSRRFGTHPVASELTIRFVGLGQSQIDQTMEDHIQLPENLTVSSQFQDGRVDFTFSLPGDRSEDRARLERLKSDLHSHLDDSIYADDADTTLEQSVIKLLARRDETLALAEVGSGGSLTAGFDSTTVVGDVLVGAYVAPSEKRMREMLDIPDDAWLKLPDDGKISMLASCAARRTHSQWAVAIGMAQQNDSSRGFRVTAAFRHPDGHIDLRPFQLSSRDTSSRVRLATQILNELRRRLR